MENIRDRENQEVSLFFLSCCRLYFEKYYTAYGFFLFSPWLFLCKEYTKLETLVEVLLFFLVEKTKMSANGHTT